MVRSRNRNSAPGTPRTPRIDRGEEAVETTPESFASLRTEETEETEIANDQDPDVDLEEDSNNNNSSSKRKEEKCEKVPQDSGTSRRFLGQVEKVKVVMKEVARERHNFESRGRH